MSTGRPCIICSSIDKSRIAAEMIAAGAPDQAIADRIGGIHRMAVSRHRRLHVAKPLQDQLALVEKGATQSQERQQLAKAAAADAPSPQQFADAVLGLKAQAEKLTRIEDRLERMAAIAEQNGSPNGVATIAGQQLRGVEVGAKLAGVGGYAPQKAQGAERGQPFVINFMFSGGRTESLAFGAPVDRAGLIDGGAEQGHGDTLDAEALPDAHPPSPELARLMAAFGAHSGRQPAGAGVDRRATASAPPDPADGLEDEDV